MHSDLKGKVVLVTGASGGIGSAIARKFAEEGSRLILHCHRNVSRAKALQRELSGTECLVVTADLAQEKEVQKLFVTARKKFRRIDTLIANAGSWESRDVAFHEMPLRQWQSTLDNVLTSTFLTVREFFKVVAAQKCGNAVMISSTAGVFGEAFHADYASAKAAMAYGLVKTLKNEMPRIAPHTANYCGGRINCICPGWTVVPRNEAKLKNAKVVQNVTATMALPQIARPEDMANAAVFLSSDTLARHITGQTLVIAGGMEGRVLWQADEIDTSIV